MSPKISSGCESPDVVEGASRFGADDRRTRNHNPRTKAPIAPPTRADQPHSPISHLPGRPPDLRVRVAVPGGAGILACPCPFGRRECLPRPTTPDSVIHPQDLPEPDHADQFGHRTEA